MDSPNSHDENRKTNYFQNDPNKIYLEDHSYCMKTIETDGKIIEEHDLTIRGCEESPLKSPSSRWRQRNPESHEKVKSCRRRNSGRPCQNSKKNFIPPRSIGNPCFCKKNCRSLLAGKELKIFHSFWDLGDYHKQNIYLFSRIHVGNVQRHYKCRIQDPSKSLRRNISCRYSVNVSGKSIIICKVEFLAVHGLQFSKKRIELLIRQIESGAFVPKSDGRGKHENHKKTAESSLNMVREHINIIPKYVSHYSREVNPNKVYLDSDLNISGLYRKYCEWIDEKNKSFAEAVGDIFIDGLHVYERPFENLMPVSEDKYRRIFCNEFNIGFKLPRSDTCKTCDEIQIQLKAHQDDEVITTSLNRQLESHQIEASAMAKDLKATSDRAKDSNDIDVFSFDHQQSLQTPNLTVGAAFYSRKVMTYNFGIHNANKSKGHMFMWPENFARKGSDETASCIWKYVQNNKPENDDLIVFSDNCAGQNKNWNLISFWYHLVRAGIYKSIEHRSLIPGHTRLPCDRDFALIENEKKRTLQIYSPKGWFDLVRNANQKEPFDVYEMKTADFLTFDQLLKNITKRTIKDDKSPLKFREVRCFSFMSTDSNVMRVKYALVEEFSNVTVAKAVSCAIGGNIECLPKKYDGPIRISNKKIEDLHKLMPFVPIEDRRFYEDIFATCGCEDVDDVEYV